MPKVNSAYKEERNKYIIDCTLEVLSEKSLEQVSMRDIIKKTGFSQGTIYNYYKNIDEIMSVIICRYMYKMKEELSACIHKNNDFYSCYHDICNCMVNLYEDDPVLFEAMLGKISYHTMKNDNQDILFEIYKVGKELNEMIIALLKMGMSQGIVRVDLNLYVVVFHLWSSIGQTILFSHKKQYYIENQIHMTSKKYMEQGFELIISSVTN
ncbi:MAG: TetR/AcrR family transcriptional regulator [Lachnospiraceae bacterium]|nr:TetR/AcrR family transcriptional regulator [Lachnospiraceae bacterium]